MLEQLGLGDEVFLSFLPLSHSYEHTAGEMFPISIGAQIYFAEGAETLAANMLEARPTIMTAVPRLYETLHQRIRLGVERKGGISQKMFDRAVAIGRKRLLAERTSLGERLCRSACSTGSFAPRFASALAAGSRRWSRAARRSTPRSAGFFWRSGSLCCRATARPRPDPSSAAICRRGSRSTPSGRRSTVSELRIAEDGEILVAGDNVMKGYWNDPEATAHALEDGWLHTGDVGTIDEDGYLRITDRKRDFIKNSGGEMISPARIEGYLTLEPEISQVMVFGDRRPYLVAVVVPDPEFVAAYVDGEVPADLSALAADPGFTKAIGAAVNRVNLTLSPSERVRRFVVAAEAFTIANGQMTPTLKIKRHVIRESIRRGTGRALPQQGDRRLSRAILPRPACGEC